MRRNARIITAFGKTATTAQWEHYPHLAVNIGTVIYRIDRGWTPESAILTPARSKKRILAKEELPRGVSPHGKFQGYRSCPSFCEVKALTTDWCQAATIKDIAAILRHGPAGTMSRPRRFKYYKNMMESLGYRVPVIC